MHNPTLLARWAAVAFLSASLAACGGDGGDDVANPPVGGTPMPDPGAPVPPAPAPGVAVTGQFHLDGPAATSTAALATMNTLGQQGYAFVSTIASYAANPLPALGDLFVKDSAHTASKLQYQGLAPGADRTAALAQMNQQGAAGYMYKGDVGYGNGANDIRSLFVKDTTKATTYSYETLAGGSPMGKTALLAQLNAQGARGYRYLSPAIFNGSTDIHNVYVKTSVPGTYSYTFFDVAAPFGMANGAALKAKLNEAGATGALFRGALVVDNFTTGVQVYEKSSASPGAISYDLVAVNKADTLAQGVAKANVRAAVGEFMFGDLVTNDNQIHTIYMKGGELRHPLSGSVFP